MNKNILQKTNSIKEFIIGKINFTIYLQFDFLSIVF